MYILYIITGSALLISLLADRKKTFKALKISVRRFIKILPAFILMLIMISIMLFVLPQTLLSEYLGQENKTSGVLIASLIGSIALFPGFIAFPLCGILLKQNVSYMVLSAFTTTLMMVGIITFPVEKAYLGVRVTILRNVISFVNGLIVAIITGLVFKEIGI